MIGGRADSLCLLLQKQASLEARNIYGGTALGQALWSAVNDDLYIIDYIDVIGILLKAGAKIEAGSLAWLEQQNECSSALKARIAELLRQHGAEEGDR